MKLFDSQYDCIVLGGGPAGSTVAALVAQAGYKTLQLEREKTPRFHIGESLMPETYWTFERLGVLDRMKKSAHTKKYSVQFVNERGAESTPFRFDEHDPRDCSQTWQVRRSEFDQMLWENAAEKGADCRDESRVLEVLFDGDLATGVVVQSADGAKHSIAARVVVDASGQQSIIANRLGLRVVDPHLRKSAVWTYYQGAERVEGRDGGATIVLHTESKRAWFWYIPLLDDVTSVGVVGDSDELLKQGKSVEEIFHDQLALCQAVAKRVDGAKIAGPYRVAKEFSYSSRRSSGDGWVLVGDAWGFIDPIYSSGVFIALKSGELAADAIVEGLNSGDLSAAQLGKWSPEFTAATRWVRKLVDAFYTPEFSFGQFMRAHPEHQGALTDLLIGRIFHESAGDIFHDMDPWLEKARRGENEAAPAANK